MTKGDEIIERRLEFARLHNHGATIEVKLKAASSKSSIVGLSNEGVVISVHSHPVGGKANAEALRLMAKFLGVPVSRIQILRGDKSRRKTFLVVGMTRDDMISRLRDISEI